MIVVMMEVGEEEEAEGEEEGQEVEHILCSLVGSQHCLHLMTEAQ